MFLATTFSFLAYFNFADFGGPIFENALFLVGLAGISFGWVLLGLAGHYLSVRKALRRFYSFLEKEECRAQIAMHAGGPFELAEWYKRDPQILFSSVAHVRSFGRAILASYKPSLKCGHSACLFEAPNSTDVGNLRSLNVTARKALEGFNPSSSSEPDDP
ncbi:MAG: hypothetical protein ACJ76N_04120 [Thermoanaerobaculia bacterium]